MLNHVLIRKSERGDICLFDERDNLVASYKNGKWIADDVFEYDDFDHFTVVTDEAEIEKLSADARRELNKPLILANEKD